MNPVLTTIPPTKQRSLRRAHKLHDLDDRIQEVPFNLERAAELSTERVVDSRHDIPFLESILKYVCRNGEVWLELRREDYGDHSFFAYDDKRGLMTADYKDHAACRRKHLLAYMTGERWDDDKVSFFHIAAEEVARRLPVVTVEQADRYALEDDIRHQIYKDADTGRRSHRNDYLLDSDLPKRAGRGGSQVNPVQFFRASLLYAHTRGGVWVGYQFCPPGIMYLRENSSDCALWAATKKSRLDQNPMYGSASNDWLYWQGYCPSLPSDPPEDDHPDHYVFHITRVPSQKWITGYRRACERETKEYERQRGAAINEALARIPEPTLC
jgi:hypothetical protein